MGRAQTSFGERSKRVFLRQKTRTIAIIRLPQIYFGWSIPTLTLPLLMLGLPNFRAFVVAVENANVGSEETPVIRLLDEPAGNDWNQLEFLTDPEVNHSPRQSVKNRKLRGPFLSCSDFVNRRLALGPMDSDPNAAKARG